jgi:transcriptional regulator with XRE-family HTH domain
MPSQSDLTFLSPKERREYGFARIRDAAFDAVSALWKRRQDEGMSQAQIAAAIGGDTGWVSKNLRGPGNWTMKTFGTFVEALNGEAQIIVRAAEDALPVRSNYHAYVGYEPEMPTATADATSLPQARSSFSSTSIQNRRGLNTAILIP